MFIIYFCLYTWLKNILQYIPFEYIDTLLVELGHLCSVLITTLSKWGRRGSDMETPAKIFFLITTPLVGVLISKKMLP